VLAGWRSQHASVGQGKQQLATLGASAGADSLTPLSTSEEAMDIKRREYLAANRKQA
jgi:hypothetical protein